MQLVEGQQSITLGTNGGGGLEMDYNLSGNSGKPVPVINTRNPDTGQWAHLAVTKLNSTVTVWHQGSKVFSTNVPSGQTWTFGNTTTLSVGRVLPGGDGHNWQGKVWWSNVRVLRICIYTLPFQPSFPLDDGPGVAALIKSQPPTSLGTTCQITGPGTSPSFVINQMPSLGSYVT